MTTHLFTAEDILRLEPFNIDLDLAAERGLAEGGAVSEDYLRLEAFYGEAFWQMLLDQANLKAFDEGLAQSEMNFIPKAERHWNVYQRYHSYGTAFVYLRNNFCIERLTDAQLDRLNALSQSVSPESEEAVQFVADTFRQVIKLDPNGEDDTRYFYDLGTGNSGPNLAVMVGIGTAIETDENGRMRSSEHEQEKLAFLRRLAPQLAEEMTEVLGLPVVVLPE